MRRVRLLALAIVALALAATAAAGATPPAARWAMRLALVVALPLAAGALAGLWLPRSSRRMGTSAKVRGTARYHAVLVLALLADLAPIGIGYLLGWTTFTYGDQALEARKLVVLPLALPFAIAAATLGSEWALRARLWEVGSRAGRPREAAYLSMLGGVALALPAVVPGFVVADRRFVVSALAVALAREAASLALFRSGGLLVAGAYRGTLAALEGFALADWYSYYFPMANYVSSVPAFYALRLAGPVAAVALILALAGRRRETP